MSFYKTFKHIAEKGVINGVNYDLEEYVTYYHPYQRIEKEKYVSYGIDEIDLADFHLENGADSLNSRKAKDQYGNEWYEKENSYGGLWIAYADGVRLNDEPMEYCEVCQLISKHCGLPKQNDSNYYEYCYRYLTKCYDRKSYRAYNGEYVPNYESMFKVNYKIGDRVFYVKEYDRDTRNGWRRQIESFIIEDITIECGVVMFYNYNHNDNYFSLSHQKVKQSMVTSSVEELCKIYKGSTLYMWHRNGMCMIEPCNSTAIYLKYNKD